MTSAYNTLFVVPPACATSVDNVVLLIVRSYKPASDCTSRDASAYNSLFNHRMLRDRNICTLFWIPLACVTRFWFHEPWCKAHRIPCSWSHWRAKEVICHVMNQTRVIATTAWIWRSWTFCDPYFSFNRPLSLSFPYVWPKKKRKKIPPKNKHGVDTVIIIFAQCPRHLCYFSSKIKKVH